MGKLDGMMQNGDLQHEDGDHIKAVKGTPLLAEAWHGAQGSTGAIHVFMAKLAGVADSAAMQENQDMLLAWGSLARSLDYDADFLQGSLPLAVRGFAAGALPPAQQAQLAADLAAAGAASAGRQDMWAFVMVLDALTAAFRNSITSAGSRSGAAAGLADALMQLVQGLHDNGQASAAAFSRLFALHSDAASQLLSLAAAANSRRGVAVPPPDGKFSAVAAVAALRILTPALAAAAEGVAAAEGAAPIQQCHQTVMVLRRYWLLSALLDRQWGLPQGILRGTPQGGPSSTTPPQPQLPAPKSWQPALGRLALASPELAPGSGSAAAAARLESEVAPQLRALGPLGELAPLQGALESLGGVLLDKTAALAAHLLAAATAHLACVRHAPLPLLLRSGGVQAQSLLRYMELTPADSREYRQLEAIAQASFRAYLIRLRGGSGSSQDAAQDVAACQLALAVSLAGLLADATPRHIAQLARDWLQQALAAFPWLRWQSPLTKRLAEVWDAQTADARTAGMRGERQPDMLAATMLRQVVTDSAAQAPHWTDAAQAAADGNDSHAAALRHTVALSGAFAAGRSRYSMADFAGPILGIEAVHAKAVHRGRAQGALGTAHVEGKPPAVVLQGVLHRLQHAVAAGTPSNETLEDALSLAAAEIVVAPDPQSEQVQQLVSLLAWAPARVLTPAAARLAAFAWFWVAAEAPVHLVPLVSGIMDALAWTAEQRLGMFSSDFDTSGFVLESRGDTLAGVQAQRSAADEVRDDVPALEAHHTWLLFLQQTWQVVDSGPSPQHAAVRAVLQRGLLAALASGQRLSQHPAAAGAVFRLLQLGLQAAGHAKAGAAVATQLRALVLLAVLRWFSAVPAWYGRWSPAEAREQARAVCDFAGAVAGAWGANSGSDARVALLRLLLQVEVDRLEVWAAPVRNSVQKATPPGSGLSVAMWVQHAVTAWQVDPRLLLALQRRFPSVLALQTALEDLVRQHANDASLQAIPEAASLLATARNINAQAPELAALERWAPAPLLEATALLAGASGGNKHVRAYALRSLTTASKPEEVAFFLPQLVQQLRADEGGLVEQFLLHAASHSVLFAHLLLCALKTEGKPPEEAFNPTVKRSGWQPPQDTGLWEATDAVRSKVWAALEPPTAEHLKAELDLFSEVTSVSGQLYEVPKPERKARAVEILRDVKPGREDLYLPVNAQARVLDVIPDSATMMQSAAKVPILVAFKVELDERVVEGRRHPKEQTTQACIFKVGDDCRQDILALQVIGLLKEAYEKAGLHLPMAPYGVIATDYECGIIEVVPNCQSRSALGETCDGGLREIFARDFGPPGSEGFEAARLNFLRSEAGYAIACYLLNIKDRHNGNIMIDRAGHLVHIDFGFILEISPGGNLGFESAPFKLSHEMTQLLDPGGHRASPQYALFEELCIRAFLAARGVADGIMATVQLMAASGLPCFGRGKPVDNLCTRFRLDLTDAQAADFMRKQVQHAYNKWTTGFYDYVQYIQNRIPK